MKFVIIAVVVLVFALASVVLAPSPNNSSDPCDGYGNCISSSVSYIRANPDGSLYLGDEFAVTPSVSLGPNTTSYSYSWSYDGAVLAAQGGWLLQVVANAGGAATIFCIPSSIRVDSLPEVDRPEARAGGHQKRYKWGPHQRRSMTSISLGDKGGATLFAVGGVMLLVAYFWGLWIGPANNITSLVTWVFDFVLAFVGFYLVGSGLWMIIHSALVSQRTQQNP